MDKCTEKYIEMYDKYHEMAYWFHWVGFATSIILISMISSFVPTKYKPIVTPIYKPFGIFGIMLTVTCMVSSLWIDTISNMFFMFNCLFMFSVFVLLTCTDPFCVMYLSKYDEIIERQPVVGIPSVVMEHAV